MNWTEMKEVLELLDKEKKLFEMFKNCPYHVLKTVKLKRYPQDSFCLNQEEIYDKFYIIAEGEVDIFLVSDSGKKYFLTTYEKGQFLGEMELFERLPYLSRVEGRGPVVTLEVERDVYLDWIETDHNFNQYILRKLCNLTYASMQKMGKDNLYTLKQRICMYLIECTADKKRKSVPLNVEILSERMGVTARSVNRVLKELKDKEILEISNSKVEVKDFERLIKEKNEK